MHLNAQGPKWSSEEHADLDLVLLNENAVLEGYVTHADTEAPLEFVMLVLQKEQQEYSGSWPKQSSVYTDERGYYRLSNLSSGNYELTIFYAGFETQQLKVHLGYGAHKANYGLKPLAATLKSIKIEAEESSFKLRAMRAIEATTIYAGKKSERLAMDDLVLNKASNQARQIYSRVAGVHVWESDAGGLQLGIGGRGLSPNRTANFNTRQEGIDIAADALGYPESYYTPPAEAIDRIEILRGAASLQYGTQFGGLLNFVLRDAPAENGSAFRIRQSVGSFGLSSTYADLGFKGDKWKVFGFYQYKRGNEWRPNSAYKQHTAAVKLNWEIHEAHEIKIGLTHMNYLAQQAGGLTDAMFAADPSQSIRDRNWFAVNWNVFNASHSWNITPRSTWETRFFGLLAQKESLGYLGLISRADPGEERDFFDDYYKNTGVESRLLHRYTLGNLWQASLLGVRLYQGNTQRSQGLASDGNDASFEYLESENLEFDYIYPSQNLAVFTEHIFRPHPKWSIVPGIRYEFIRTDADGFYRENAFDLAGNLLFDTLISEQISRDRDFVLFGLGISHQIKEELESYFNVSQNYRAINFNDLRVVNPNQRVDPNIIDERGWSSDLGFRGNIASFVHVDFSFFGLLYRDRIGQLLGVDSLSNRTYTLRSNIADAYSLGFEAYLEFALEEKISLPDEMTLHPFINGSHTRARYYNSDQAGVEGNEVELVPDLLITSGIDFNYADFGLSGQVNYVSEHYSDATNAIQTPDATVGIVPSYFIIDFSCEYTHRWEKLSGTIEAGINNALNQVYFSRRATGFPGPGIIPGAPRSWYVGLEFNF
jgi:Fe(3+) dicitrate transport protein